MQDVFKRLSEQFAQHPYPSLAERKQALQQFREAVKTFADALCLAVNTDFGYRSADETRLLEIMPTLTGIDYHLKHLKNWMKPQRRHVHYTFWPAKNQVITQPLGVVGIIAPWNYPVFLATGPLIAALAAGNQVMLKLSEFTPATNAVLRDMFTQCLPRQVAVIEGDAGVAAQFSALPFAHLLFTGSTNIGRKVMQAASANLTPVTLELGGKSPVIIGPDADVAEAVPRLLFGKTANAGQTCVAPDYLLLPRNKLPVFLQRARESFDKLYPAGVHSIDHSAVINQQQFDRITGYLDEASALGAKIVSLDGQVYTAANARKLAPQLVLDAPLHAKLWHEEIFGPVLPVKLYDDITEAVSFIKQQPRPLALYLFSHNKALQQQILQHTHAGGVCINDTLVHVGQDDLPFGGIGPSGIGHYHGKEGFLSFSHQKAVHSKGRFSSGSLAYPPYDRTMFRVLLNWLLR